MKRLLIFAFVTAAVLFVSCQKTPDRAVVDIDPEALYNELSEAYCDDDIELVELDRETADLTFGLGGMYSAIYAKASIGAFADSILVLEASDLVSAEKIYDMLKTYCEERTKLFASYALSEVPKLENALMERAGKYVVFVVSDDIEKAEEIWNSYKG